MADALRHHFRWCIDAKRGLIAQNINFELFSFLVIFMTIEFISHLVSCFSAIGGVIFSRKLFGNGQ